MIKADIDYPLDILPMPAREGNSVQHVQPFLRTQLASGRVRQRRLFSLVPSMQKFRWVLNREQAAGFEAWFKWDIEDGSKWFNMRTNNPLGQECEIVARFAKMYDGPDLMGLCHFVISAELEVFERPLMPKEWRHEVEWFGFRDEFDILMNQKWPKYYANN